MGNNLCQLKLLFVKYVFVFSINIIFIDVNKFNIFVNFKLVRLIRG